MAKLPITRYGVFAIHDSGAPEGSDEYPTVVILHGFSWHADVFRRLLPLAQKFNARLVLVNRRDYPGSIPFKEEELRSISSIKSDTPEPLAILKDFMKQRAKELRDFLQLFVRKEKIPRGGGLVVTGWSFGANWMTALLANARDFPVGDVPLAAYIRRVVLDDPPYHALGYPPPANFYDALSELSKSDSPVEAFDNFQSYITGYYEHGDLPSGLEFRTPLAEPRPTFETMSPEDIESSMDPAPAYPGRAENVLLEAGMRYRLFRAMKEAMLYLPAAESLNKGSANGWDAVKLRYIWCDHSSWETPWGAWAFQTELEEAKTAGKRMREVQMVRLRGANHFAHWDQPERLLHALLDDDV